MNANYERNDGPDWVLSADMICEIRRVAKHGGFIFLPDFDMLAVDLALRMEVDHNRWHHRYCS